MSDPARECVVLHGGDSYEGRQGLSYASGASAETAGTEQICMHRLTIPPGARAKAHLHEDHESVIYLISGEVDFWFGPQLEHHRRTGPGDFVYIPAGVAHLPVNFGDQPAEAVISRTDPNEQESVVVLPELDSLPHVQQRP
jgi:uncharacterized RmlC-like cupin family protein